MLVTVRLFAGLRERLGGERLEVELPEAAVVGDVLAAVGVGQGECVVAVNREYAALTAPVCEGDEVALVPPVSGGAPVARITDQPLSPGALLESVRHPRAGAVVVFEGATREVEHLDYEAYEEMAVQRMEQIALEEQERHGLCAVAVEHRVGRVGLSEPSVVVAVSAPHRGEAFAGARAIIDRVKAEAPIFKREEGRWVEGVLPGPDA